MLRICLQPDTQQGVDGYVAGYKSPSQEDVPQHGGDEAIKVGSFHLQHIQHNDYMTNTELLK